MITPSKSLKRTLKYKLYNEQIVREDGYRIEQFAITHKQQRTKSKVQKLNQDTQVYTGSPKDGYFLLLPLQFYYGDEELHS